MIGDAKRMITLVTDYKSKGGKLGYDQKLVSQIRTALAAAEKEWVEAQDALAAQQEAPAQVRRLAASVQAELVAMRATPQTVLGSTPRDYQRLRIEQAAEVTEDDQPEPGTPPNAATEQGGRFPERLEGRRRRTRAGPEGSPSFVFGGADGRASSPSRTCTW